MNSREFYCALCGTGEKLVPTGFIPDPDRLTATLIVNGNRDGTVIAVCESCIRDIKRFRFSDIAMASIGGKKA